MLKLGIIMDQIDKIAVYKDSSFAMLLQAQRRGYQIYYMQLEHLYMRGGEARARARILQVFDQNKDYYRFDSPSQDMALSDLDVILMRKDPPFDMEYIYATYMLEQAERSGVLVVNAPQSLRDANEKMFALNFADCIAPVLVSRQAGQIRDFIRQHQQTVIKPLDGMGGASIFRIDAGDPNTNVIIETLTDQGQKFAMIQRYLPQIREGDKRILLINGKPVPYALARIPPEDDHRGNIAAGGRGKGVPLSKRDYWLCEQIRDTLVEKRLIFVGIDVIGEYITEINVTSPTCIRELDQHFDLNIAGLLMDEIERLCA